MSRAAARFTQADVTRIIRGAACAGVPVAVDFLKDGTIRALVNSGVNVTMPAPAPENDLPEEEEINL